MKRTFRVKAISVFIATVMTVSMVLTSCSSKSKETDSAISTESVADAAENDPMFMEHVSGKTGYKETYVDINPGSLDLLAKFAYIGYDGENYGAVVQYIKDSNGQCERCVYYSIAAEGEIVRELELEDKGGWSYSVINGALVSEGSGKLVFSSLEDGSIIDDSLRAPSYADKIYPYKDGFVILCQNNGNGGAVVQYDATGNEIARIESADIDCFDTRTTSFWEYEGRTYIMCYGRGADFNYFEIDFETGSVELLCNSDDLGLDFSECKGQFVVDDLGIYRVDFENYEKNYFALWSSFDMRPACDMLNDDVYHIIDADRFVKTFNMPGGAIAFQMYEYDPTIDFSDRIPITVGGVEIAQDYMLNYAVYKYNTSQDTYRVYVQNYNFVGDGTTESELAFFARLNAQFNEGDTPDIFYGNDFDYEYFGRSGMVIDMLPYLETNERFDSSVLYESLWNLMCRDGVCYQLFPRFAMRGYVAREDANLNCDMTYQEMYSLAPDVNSIINTSYQHWLASYILEYSFVDFIDEDGNFILTRSELEQAITCAINNGLPASATIEDMWEGLNRISRGEILLSNDAPYSILGYAGIVDEAGGLLDFVGYPSINGSSHVIDPLGLTAVSSGAAHPEACVDFLTYFFDYDLQEMMYANNGWSSVNQEVDDAYFYYLTHLDEVEYNPYFAEYLHYASEVTPEIVDSYIEMINSVDYVYIRDFTIYSMIFDELITYDTLGKTPAEIADALYERMLLYVNENY